MDRWNRTSHMLTHYAGSKGFFGVVCALVGAWGAAGVLGGSGRLWELAVTCGVPIVTLLLVVVLQHAQNRDSKAVQLKLNELLLALDEPDSKLVGAGHLGDEELEALRVQHESQI